MKHGLPRTGSVVDDQAVTSRIQSFFIGDFFRGKKKMADKFAVRFRHAVNLGDMSLWNNERMHGCLWVHVFERDDRLVLKYDLGWDFFIDDLAENTIRIPAHDFLSPVESEKLLKKQLRAPVWHAGPV